VKPHELIDGLVHLARAASDAPLTRADQAGLQRRERTFAQRTGRRLRARIFGGLALAAALSCVALLWSLRDRALTYQVERGRVGADGYIVCDATNATLRFSDQSQVGMDPSTRLRVSRVEPRGAVMMLEEGAVHVHITPRAEASWSIDAGPYVVRVTGTDFDLAWKVNEQALDLRLRSGRVTVEGPLSGGALRLVAGQHLVANDRDGSISILTDGTPWPSYSASAVTAPAASVAQADPSAAAASEPPAPAQAGGTPPTARPTPKSSAWTDRVAHGDFQGVIEDAERRGLERTLREAPAANLAALASAARYAHKQDLARRALLAERTRFPASIHAGDAAFFLGGLAESAGDETTALTWNETYCREDPNGIYAAQALGRRMILVERLRGAEATRSVAAEYLQRFPDGPYAPSARRLLRTP
jgi:hypothetical protein